MSDEDRYAALLHAVAHSCADDVIQEGLVETIEQGGTPSLRQMVEDAYSSGMAVGIGLALVHPDDARNMVDKLSEPAAHQTVAAVVAVLHERLHE